MLGLGSDLSRQVGLQLQREDWADLGGRGHREGEGYSKGHGSRSPNRSLGWGWGEWLAGKEGDFCLWFLLCT